MYFILGLGLDGDEVVWAVWALFGWEWRRWAIGVGEQKTHELRDFQTIFKPDSNFKPDIIKLCLALFHVLSLLPSRFWLNVALRKQKQFFFFHSLIFSSSFFFLLFFIALFSILLLDSQPEGLPSPTDRAVLHQ